VPIGYLLRDFHLAVYRAALRLGAQPGSPFKGTVIGLGFLLCAFALPAGGVIAKYEIESSQGARLFDPAAQGFENYLRRNDKDPATYAFLANVRSAQGRHQ